MNGIIKPNTRAMFALTYNCTCNCAHCSAALYENTHNELLDKREVYSIITQLAENAITTVYFFGGEPLLDAELENYIACAKKLKMATCLDTNGSLLDLKKIKELKIAGLKEIGISLDSPLPEVHDFSRGIEGLFKKNIENILYCQKISLPVYITVIVTKQNLYDGELFLMTKLAERLNVQLRLLSSIQCGRWGDNEQIKLNAADLLCLKKYLKKDKVYWERPDLDYCDCSFKCTSLGKANFYISAYGDVQPCCFIPLSYGNLRQEKLEQILERMWGSEMYGKSDYSDCPVNSDYFRKSYKLDQVNNYPIKIIF